MRHVHFAFFAIAIAFIGIGLSGQRAFTYLGIAFIFIALLRLLRSRA
jgi:hypothetical protein